jgi:hypothetical protein
MTESTFTTREVTEAFPLAPRLRFRCSASSRYSMSKSNCIVQSYEIRFCFMVFGGGGGGLLVGGFSLISKSKFGDLDCCWDGVFISCLDLGEGSELFRVLFAGSSSRPLRISSRDFHIQSHANAFIDFTAAGVHTSSPAVLMAATMSCKKRKMSGDGWIGNIGVPVFFLFVVYG